MIRFLLGGGYSGPNRVSHAWSYNPLTGGEVNMIGIDAAKQANAFADRRARRAFEQHKTNNRLGSEIDRLKDNLPSWEPLADADRSEPQLVRLRLVRPRKFIGPMLVYFSERKKRWVTNSGTSIESQNYQFLHIPMWKGESL